MEKRLVPYRRTTRNNPTGHFWFTKIPAGRYYLVSLIEEGSGPHKEEQLAGLAWLVIELDAGKKLTNLVVTNCKAGLCLVCLLEKPLLKPERVRVDFLNDLNYPVGCSKTNIFSAYKPLFLLTNPLRQDTLHKDFILNLGYAPLHEAAEQSQSQVTITLVNYFCG
jgi:hypothetical protein